MLEDDDGNLVKDNKEINSQWRSYFKKLLNYTPLDETMTMEDSNTEVEPLIFEEIHDAIQRLKNKKARGIDGLLSELWKYGRVELYFKLYKLLTGIWEVEQ